MAATKPIQFRTKTAISVAMGVNRNPERRISLDY
jgi:hypothetical protein